jgi:hypothetical protein
MKLLIVHVSPDSCHFIPHRSKYSAQHPVLKTASVDVRDQVSHPCITPGKIIFLYIVIFVFTYIGRQTI